MSTPYRRRRPRVLRNLWIYRHLVALAFMMGVMLWFVFINSAAVEVHFPFGLGTVKSTSGLLILGSAIIGSLLTMMALGLITLIRRLKSNAADADLEDEPFFSDDRPPSDYAAKTPEGFVDLDWDGGREPRP